ncbi:MAG: SDR family oxidoreductase, partial [Steroidobacteraceae bacterium]
MRELSGKVAFITGGVTGIGFALAKAFASAGMAVIVTYRREDHRDEAMAHFARNPELTVHPLRLDVTDREAVRAAADQAERVFGKIHLLCNNAGVNQLGEMDKATFEDWDWIMGVNVNGVINTLMSFIPKIKAHG